MVFSPVVSANAMLFDAVPGCRAFVASVPVHLFWMSAMREPGVSSEDPAAFPVCKLPPGEPFGARCDALSMQRRHLIGGRHSHRSPDLHGRCMPLRSPTSCSRPPDALVPCGGSVVDSRRWSAPGFVASLSGTQFR
jgi:hypothetical protein